MAGRKPVCIYIDNSNIFIGGRNLAATRNEDPRAFRIDFHNFLHLVTMGTMRFDELVWAGSGGGELSPVFSELQQQGARTMLIPVTDGVENETVDMAIQLSMYRHAHKYRDNPGIIVLCTGDGKGYSREEGFLYDVKGFADEGWRLVLYSWDAICHKDLKKFAMENGEYFALEPYYNAITFIQDGRSAEAVPFSTAAGSSR